MRLLLLHPLPLDGSMWDGCLPIDCDEVIAPTLYGLGDSIEEWARSLLDLVGGEPVLVAGNSIGGSCAVELARLAPGSVAGLVLVGAKAGHRPEPEYAADALRHLREEGLESAWGTYWNPLFGDRTAPEVVERARQIALRQPVIDIERGVRVFHARADRSDVLRHWPKPVVLVEGDQDKPSRALEMTDYTPNSRLKLVADSGHYVPMERPEVMRAILEHALVAVGDGG